MELGRPVGSYHRFVHEFPFKEWLESHPSQSPMEREIALRTELGAVTKKAIESHPSIYLCVALSPLLLRRTAVVRTSHNSGDRELKTASKNPAA